MNLVGKYCKDCKIFTDNVEDDAISLIYDILNNKAFNDAKIRIMPDVHLGKGITIGFSSNIKDSINPSHVGVDVGCGIETIFFQKQLPKDMYAEFEKQIKEKIPTGSVQNSTIEFDMNELLNVINKDLHKATVSANGLVYPIQFDDLDALDKWCRKIGMDINTFYHSLGTLGGGNHFMEYDENEELKKYAFTVHTGSRNLGQKVHNYWAKIANEPTFDKDAFNNEVKEFVKNWNGPKTEIPQHITAIRSKYSANVNNGYLSNDDLKGYLTDMVIAQAYAKFNRSLILIKAASIMNNLFVNDCGNGVVEHVMSVHNYIDFDDMILRKGAIRSYKGEKMIIPFNMRDGLAICEGKSNSDWNCTAPHGSGRVMSRSKAKETIKLDDFVNQMKDVYSTSVCKNTIDEAPDAYKPTDEIINNIKDTCDILFFMKPKINIKDTAAPIEPWKK